MPQLLTQPLEPIPICFPSIFKQKWEIFLKKRTHVIFKHHLKEVVKNIGYFTVRLALKGKGGGVSATLALTISKCENFDPFFSMEYDSMILKTHFISFLTFPSDSLSSRIYVSLRAWLAGPEQHTRLQDQKYPFFSQRNDIQHWECFLFERKFSYI